MSYSFPILNQSVVPCKVLSVASWLTFRFLRRWLRWSGIPISLRIFQFVVLHTVKGFSIVNEAEVDVFLEFPCFLYDPTIDQLWSIFGNLISGVSAFSKPSLHIWKFFVHKLLKPSLKGFEHTLASMWSEQLYIWTFEHSLVVWTFYGLVLLYNWNENGPFPVLWHCCFSPVWWHTECRAFNSIIF